MCVTIEETTEQRWRSEKESAWLYDVVAAVEPDAARRTAFRKLGLAAEEQAAILAGDLGAAPPFAPSVRARLVARVVRRVGPRRARALLRAMKVRGLSMYDGPMDGHAMPTSVEGIGARHRRGGAGGTLRAAVFGVNDGLVSNTSLILGVAGAGTGQSGIVLAGVAGLLAGACSMAAGEYISMQSQRELFEHQIAEERHELERYPDAEAEELALIYEARGVPLDQARAMTRALVRDRDKALATLAREELGLNPDDLGSPWAPPRRRSRRSPAAPSCRWRRSPSAPAPPPCHSRSASPPPASPRSGPRSACSPARAPGAAACACSRWARSPAA